MKKNAANTHTKKPNKKLKLTLCMLINVTKSTVLHTYIYRLEMK